MAASLIRLKPIGTQLDGAFDTRERFAREVCIVQRERKRQVRFGKLRLMPRKATQQLECFVHPTLGLQQVGEKVHRRHILGVRGDDCAIYGLGFGSPPRALVCDGAGQISRAQRCR
jgi:hypothetical protein